MKIARPHQYEALETIQSNREGIIHLPTGTGKTFIQAETIVNNLKPNQVYVVLSPRILLTNQLYNEISEMLILHKKDCQYLLVHSGRAEDKSDIEWTNEMPYRQVNSTTSSVVIKDDYERACRENVPLIIFGTYDSSKRIVTADIPVEILLCDEAHNLVSEEFHWICKENKDTGDQFNANRKYYFTATLKETASDSGIGMNNSDEYGPVIFSKSPAEMIQAGEILRPRMHLVDVEINNEMNEVDADVTAIIDAYREHKSLLNVAPKMLVVTKGSDHLNEIVNHPKLQNLMRKNMNLKVFDISSVHKPRINGDVVSRQDFLKQLQNLDDRDEAIILHVQILTEGIDVPGITSVMVMKDLSLGTFLQTLGRATRLHKNDRNRLYNKSLLYDELDEFTKPYAWLIVPVYGEMGNDLREHISNIIYSLRTFGFRASEDVVIRQSRGSVVPVPLSGLNELNTRATTYRDVVLNVEHVIEDKIEAERLILEDFRLSEQIKNETIEETLNRFANIF